MSELTRRIRALPRSKVVQAWLHSDLIGIPVTLVFSAVVAVSLVLFYFAGNVGGLVFIISIGILTGLVLRLEGTHPQTMAGVTPAPADGRHRVLVIANLGLEEPALCAEVCRRGTRSRTEAMIIAPVPSTSWLKTATDDHGHDLDIAQGRVDVALRTLNSEGITASGHPAMGQPMQSLLDGLRQFQASEVVMLSGGELGWEDAALFAERVRTELGLRVTEVEPSRAVMAH